MSLLRTILKRAGALLSEPSLGLPKVLIVDDDRDVCVVSETYLENAGFQVKSESDPSKVLETIDRWKPDVVLLDIMMPKVDGFTILRELRSTAKRRKIVVYMMTALQLMNDIEEALSLGAKGYFVKPAKFSEIVEKLREH